jgi:formate hydrogenlyase subunit 3/multisubunit Na+/H+ antiporter MnhD subunit
LWIIAPLALAPTFYLIRRFERLTALLGLLAAGLLVFLAWVLPIGEPVSLRLWSGFPSFTLEDTLMVLGRRFVLDNSSRPILIFVYLGTAFWFAGALVTHPGRLFVPLGQAISSLLVAALAVEPFLYAALFVEMAAFASLPLLSPPGQPVRKGAIRLLTFQTLGAPFILFAGWLLPIVEANPSNAVFTLRTALLLALGFAFLMAVFPFHTWIPMLAEEAHPHAASFVFFLLPGVISLLGLNFLSSFNWLQANPNVYQGLRVFGAAMVIIGGIMAALQRHLGRIMGYAAILQIGLSLLALSLGFHPIRENLLEGLETNIRTAPSEIFYALFLQRGLGLGLWALALSVLQTRCPKNYFRDVQGLARSMPLAAATLVLAHLSLAGFPLLAGFPVQLALWSELTRQSLTISLLSLLGCTGLVAAGVRTLAVLVMGPGEASWRLTENRSQAAMLGVGMAFIFLIGFFPQLFLPLLVDMAASMSAP